VRWQSIIPLLSELSFAAGEAIVREGDDGDTLFIICSGSVEVLKASAAEDGHFEKRLAVLKVGDVFGEMELIDMQRRSATVRALEPVEALALSNADLFTIYESDLPTFTLIVLNLARELSRRLRTPRRSGGALHGHEHASGGVLNGCPQGVSFSLSCHARMAMARRPDMVMYSP
jgi:CRP/FNR family cyclic AMP-dependent transcriptional regulator